ncbi:MAG: HD family phosphohydrolase [Syntrophobacteraceae bacterium]
MMKPIRIAICIAVSLLACYAQNFGLKFFRLQPGVSAPITFRAYRPFDFDQAKAFGGRRNLALSQYVPLYIFSAAEEKSGRQQMANLLAAISPSAKGSPMDASELCTFVQKEFGENLTPADGSRLLAYPGLQNLLEGMLAIEDSLLQDRILKEPGPLKGKETAEVRYPAPMGTVAYPAARFLTIKQAREQLRKQAEKIFWQVDKQVLDPIIAIASASLAPNLIYDQKENERRIEEIVQRYPSTVIHYDAGQVLVPVRKTLTEADVLLLGVNRQAQRKDFLLSISWVAMALIILLVFHDEALSRVGRMRRGEAPSYAIHFSTLIVSILIFEALLLLTPWPLYFLPIGFVPLTLLLLGQRPVSVASTTVMAAIVAAFMSGRNIECLVFFLVGGMAALLTCRTIRKRSQLLVPAAAAGALCGLIALSFSLDGEGLVQAFHGRLNGSALMLALPGLSSMHDVGWAVAGGLVAAPLAAAVLPFFESFLRTSSTFKIGAWTNLEHPILKDLLNRAPGTYQHTMSVASLAQAAGEAIGANVPLLRAGVYFHDIGKMATPGYFTENQGNGVNPHDELEAVESAKIIIAHVTNGLRIGRKAKLPPKILDFIPQHHGTMILEYFWGKARHGDPDLHPEEKEFRYAGPKPQSREAAILMIVDAVEAASRTLPEPGRAAVEAIVRYIIEKRLDDGQFDECDLTTEELGRVRVALVDAVSAAFHSRVSYPWQEEAGGDVSPASVKK